MYIVNSVNFTIPGDDDDYISIDDNTLLSDSDIVLFRPGNTSQALASNSHWREEIINILKLGKTVFVLLSKPEKYSYDFLPIPLEIIAANGVEIYPKDKLVEPIYNGLKEFWSVNAYLKPSNNHQILFSTKNNDRILGAYHKVELGHILLMPNITYDDDEYWGDDEWNEQGKMFGKKIKHQLSHIHSILNSAQVNSIKPDWIDIEEYQLQDSLRIINEIESNVEVMTALQNKNDLLFLILKSKEMLKGLLFETGKQLEEAVIQAMKLLGYHAENYDDGILELDQIILSPEKERYIGECEGKENKPIDVSKFRQLQDNIKEDFEKEDVEEMAYGLLFGNPQRLTMPSERNLDFTEKCKKGAAREKIGLINTVDLYRVVKYLSENDDENYKLKCRNAIKDQLGSIIRFPPPPPSKKHNQKK